LLRPGADGAGGRVYEPALARDLPALVTLGRAFTLTNAVWTDPANPNARTAVTAADVVTTVEKLAKRKGQPGAEVADWIAGVSTEADKTCRITLTRGHIDPLSLMTFKVLPSKSLDDQTFARNPIGSGPFMYGGRATKGGREYAIFPANPFYTRPNPPRLKAVWMVTSRNPAADFRGGLIHFAVTTNTGELAVLNAKPQPAAANVPITGGKLEVNIENRGRVDTLFGRRVYFLAVNHQSPALGGDKGRDLRKFLAAAIQREAILTADFRAGFDKHHQPLTGPFPPDTWPCSRSASSPLDDPYLAGGLRKDKSDKVQLELKYPDGDQVIAQACKRMAEQVAGLNAGVTLLLKAVEPDKYYQEVVFDTDFKLAYWHYDYPDDWFSPAGLFDQSARSHGGRNFMGYVPPTDIQALLTRCQDRRDFGVVREAMHRLDASFRTEMPFIPLWHLDMHALLAAGLTTVPPAAQIDPLAPFSHIEQWSVK
jgi:ABC-type oligopeptide transport system substrate-binding subunit